MAPKRHTLGVRAQIDREIAELDRKREREIRRFDEERARLVAARAALQGKAVSPQPRSRRFSQEEIAAYLAEHPGSTYTEIAAGLGAPTTNVASHLTRGQKAGRFRNCAGKWSVEE